eukprot:COSAG05_NODE_1598_length_4453_cov_5.666514_5_plen_37_part_00
MSLTYQFDLNIIQLITIPSRSGLIALDTGTKEFRYQ